MDGWGRAALDDNSSTFLFGKVLISLRQKHSKNRFLLNISKGEGKGLPWLHSGVKVLLQKKRKNPSRAIQLCSAGYSSCSSCSVRPHPVLLLVAVYSSPSSSSYWVWAAHLLLHPSSWWVGSACLLLRLVALGWAAALQEKTRAEPYSSAPLSTDRHRCVLPVVVRPVVDSYVSPLCSTRRLWVVFGPYALSLGLTRRRRALHLVVGILHVLSSGNFKPG